MKSFHVLLPAVTAWLISPMLLWQGIAFTPNNQQSIKYVDSQLSAVLEPGTDPYSIEISLGGVKPSKVSTVKLPTELAQVDSIRRSMVGDLVVLGMLNGAVSEVVVIDTQSSLIKDKFYAYKPTISPDSRFVAFVKFYPPHFVSGTTDQYVLYDLAKTAQENRLPKVPADDYVNVGVIVFPEDTANVDYSNLNASFSEVHQDLANKFFWSIDSRYLLFMDLYQNRFRLYKLDTTSSPRITTYVIPETQECVAPGCLLLLEQAVFKGPNSISVNLRESTTSKSVELSIQDKAFR